MYKHLSNQKWVVSLTATVLFSFAISAQVPTPKEHFGFTPGDDRMLFLYENMMDYMRKLEKASPMVHIEEIGQTEMGRPMYIVFVSSEENIRNLESLRQINRQLALDEIPSGTGREDLFEKGKVFFFPHSACTPAKWVRHRPCPWWYMNWWQEPIPAGNSSSKIQWPCSFHTIPTE
jgi:hypothetical protein